MLIDFYVNLICGKVDRLRRLFPGEPALDAPGYGAMQGDAALSCFAETAGSWLRSSGARPVFVWRLDDAARSVIEFRLELKQEGRIVDLPVALVGEKLEQGFSQVRIYHSTWPITGVHLTRPPVVQLRGPISAPPVIEAYFAALSAGDADAIMETFTPDGYVREPSGERFRHDGVLGRRAFYDAAFAQPGGVSLSHAAATFDGLTFAVEYSCNGWGPARFTSMAGCAVYELALGGTLIRAVRIYDDVTPPGDPLDVDDGLLSPPGPA